VQYKHHIESRLLINERTLHVRIQGCKGFNPVLHSSVQPICASSIRHKYEMISSVVTHLGHGNAATADAAGRLELSESHGDLNSGYRKRIR
jgi:hypothetical protein